MKYQKNNELENLKEKEPVMWNCPICHKQIKKISKAQHMNLAHKKVQEKRPKHKCTQCNKDFVFMKGLKDHVMNIHEGIRHQCNKCDKNFAFRSDLLQHKKLQHEKNVIFHKCEKCDKKFKLKVYLRQHFKRLHQK